VKNERFTNVPVNINSIALENSSRWKQSFDALWFDSIITCLIVTQRSILRQ